MPTYDQPIFITYFLAAATISTAADLLDIAGPKDLEGRVVAMSSIVTTGVTTTATAIDVGTGSDDDAYATMTIPVSAADAVFNTVVNLTSDDVPIPKNTRVVLSTAGEGDAGAANLWLTIAWF